MSKVNTWAKELVGFEVGMDMVSEFDNLSYKKWVVLQKGLIISFNLSLLNIETGKMNSGSSDVSCWSFQGVSKEGNLDPVFLVQFHSHLLQIG